MATKKRGKKKVGKWTIKRVGENQLAITLPAGMTIRDTETLTLRLRETIEALSRGEGAADPTSAGEAEIHMRA